MYAIRSYYVTEATNRVNQLEQALAATPGDVSQLQADLRALEDSLVEVQVALSYNFV